MPTTPIPAVLSRTQERDVTQVLNQFATILEEAVSIGTHIFTWVVGAVAGRRHEVIPVTMSFHHIVEVLDGVSIQIKQGSIEPCKILLRSVLDSALGIHYLLKADTDRRSIAFMVWHVHRMLKLYDKHDLNTQPGQEFLKKLESSFGTDPVHMPTSAELGPDRDKLEKLLLRPEYQEAENEYQLLISSGTANPAWHSFFGGPKNIEQLAGSVGMAGWYESLYRSWSGLTHGTDIIVRKLRTDVEGKGFVLPIRDLKDAQMVVSLALSLVLPLFSELVKRFVPVKKEDYLSWYFSEMRSFYLRLSSETILTVK